VDPTRVLPQVSVEAKEDLTLKMRPTKILNRGVKELMIMARRPNRRTWEREFEMKKKYPELFEQPGKEHETSLISRMKFY